MPIIHSNNLGTLVIALVSAYCCHYITLTCCLQISRDLGQPCSLRSTLACMNIPLTVLKSFTAISSWPKHFMCSKELLSQGRQYLDWCKHNLYKPQLVKGNWPFFLKYFSLWLTLLLHPVTELQKSAPGISSKRKQAKFSSLARDPGVPAKEQPWKQTELQTAVQCNSWNRQRHEAIWLIKWDTT